MNRLRFKGSLDLCRLRRGNCWRIRFSWSPSQPPDAAAARPAPLSAHREPRIANARTVIFPAAASSPASKIDACRPLVLPAARAARALATTPATRPRRSRLGSIAKAMSASRSPVTRDKKGAAVSTAEPAPATTSRATASNAYQRSALPVSSAAHAAAAAPVTRRAVSVGTASASQSNAPRANSSAVAMGVRVTVARAAAMASSA